MTRSSFDYFIQVTEASRGAAHKLVVQAQPKNMDPEKHRDDRATLALCAVAAAITYVGDVIHMCFEPKIVTADREDGTEDPRTSLLERIARTTDDEDLKVEIERIVGRIST